MLQWHMPILGIPEARQQMTYATLIQRCENHTGTTFISSTWKYVCDGQVVSPTKALNKMVRDGYVEVIADSSPKQYRITNLAATEKSQGIAHNTEAPTATKKSKPRKTAFQKWFDTFIDEKGLDRDEIIEVEGESGLNMMPLQVLIDAINSAPKHEQAGIKTMIVRIDFANGDVMHYFNHLAKALAI